MSAQPANEIDDREVEDQSASELEDDGEASDDEVTGEDYLAQIEKKRLENARLLQATAAAVAPVYATPAAPKPAGKKRRKDPRPTEPVRRSARVQAKTRPYTEAGSDSDSGVPLHKRPKRTHPAAAAARPLNPDSAWSLRKAALGPKGNGKLFGELPGHPVGSWWRKRDECGHAGVHPPPVSGIYWHRTDGAFSVAVSAGYPEDADDGDTFTYTGSGGRRLREKNLRTAPQTMDQELTPANSALCVSAQNGNPVRVIRGYRAALGPVTGYRYDGLYRVVRAYEALSSDGRFKVWKFDFVRLPGQVPVDYGAKERARREEEEARKAEEEANAQLEVEAGAGGEKVEGGEVVAAAVLAVDA